MTRRNELNSQVPKPATIKDVARRAGVSITTVSHALNDRGRVSDETRARVWRVAKILEYRPMASARNLGGGRTGIIALSLSQPPGTSIPVTDFDYFRQLNSGATSAALDAGFSLITLPTGRGSERLARTPIDGAIVIDPTPSDAWLAHLRSTNIPFVSAGRDVDGPETDSWVDNDHAAATRAVLGHLQSAGAQRIALVSVPLVHSYAMDIRKSYETWCSERRMQPLVEETLGTTSEAGGFNGARNLLRGRNPPDAIYAGLDGQALGVLHAAEETGHSVPGDLLVACCTDSAASGAAVPPLTALNLNPHRLGGEAIAILLRLIDGQDSSPETRMIPWKLLRRGSTDRLSTMR